MARLSTPRKAAPNTQKLLQRFAGDEDLLARHSVTDEELELLNTVSLFGRLGSARDVVFILKNMRGTKPAR